jgi:hypothetical protein
MGLVGSLVFFLLEVLYGGDYQGRLRWIFFFFVFGAVLTARLAMVADVAHRANLYGIVLGFLVWLGMQIYIEFPAGTTAADLSWLINMVLIGIVWWCSHRLTWDCTHIDEETDVTGTGLLQAAGFEEEAASKEPAANPEPAQPKTWKERYKEYCEEKKQRRTLGVWVVYFSLGALPLFGLGQSLIPVENAGRRQYAFWLMSIYVAAGLGLLLTTCFLSLRRYLRQRRLQMPAAMTGAWLSAGGVMILLLLAAGALLPRPLAEYPLIDFQAIGSQKRSSSNYAFKGDSPGKGEGRPGENPPPGKGDPDDRGGGNGEKGQKGQGQGGSKQGEQGSGKGKQASGQGQKSSGQQGSSKGPKNSKSQNKTGQDSNNRQEQQGQSQDQDGADSKKNSRTGSQKDERKNKDNQSQKQSEDDSSDREDSQRQNESKSSSASSSSSLKSFFSQHEWMSRLATVLKWIIFALLAAVALFYVLRSGLQFLANFTDWARRLLDAWHNFWANLFGRRGGSRGEEEEEEEAPVTPPPPFSSFANPFETGKADRMPTGQLLRYTFAALQAWAREANLGRLPGETPLEFAARIGGEVPPLEADVRQLTILYARAVYARGGLPGNTKDLVRTFWERLEAIAEHPLSA